MKEEKELTFEEIMNRLEALTGELESGKLSLDDSVKKFEQGMEFSKQASQILENAEKRITILIDNNGEIQEENFEN